MLFSKANLAVKSIASPNPDEIGINCIRFNVDGSTVATNGKVIMAVSPVDPSRVHFPDVGEQVEPANYSASGIGIPLDTIEKVLKIIPKDKRTALQHVALCKDREPRKVKFTTTDMTDEQSLSVYPKNDPFPEWEGICARIRGEGGIKLCISRNDLMELLAAIDSASPDRGGTSPVWIEISPEGKGLVIRSENRDTGQRVIGVMTALNTNGQWLPADNWERSVFGFAAHTLKKVVTTIKKLVKS